MGILFSGYLVVRIAHWWEGRCYRNVRPDSPRWDSKRPGVTGLDVSKLSGRVEELRQDHYPVVSDKSNSFKKPLLVEETRREVQKLAFFQKPPPTPTPPSEPTEHDGGFSVLFI